MDQTLQNNSNLVWFGLLKRDTRGLKNIIRQYDLAKHVNQMPGLEITEMFDDESVSRAQMVLIFFSP